MSADEDLRNCLRNLAEAVPRDAGLAVEQRLLKNYRTLHKERKRRFYFAGIAASLAMAAGLYLALWHGNHARREVSSDSNPEAGFVTLPYGESGVPLEQPVIVRVDIPASELDLIGAPLSVTGGRGRVKADLLVGQDGVARAVRFVE